MKRKFSLHALLIATSILCLIMARLNIELRLSKIEQAHLSELRNRGFELRVTYDFQIESDGYINQLEHPKENLFTSFFDEMAFTHVKGIVIDRDDRDDLVPLKNIAEVGLYRFSELEYVTTYVPIAESFEGLEDLPHLKGFMGFFLGDVINFDALADSTIEDLFLTDAANLSELTFLKEMKSLKTLRIEHCPSLKSISLGGGNEQLSSVDIRACDSLQAISNLPSNLSELNVEDCGSLLSLNLPDNLFRLEIFRCDSLLSISDLPSNLSELHMASCSSLLSISDSPNTLSNLFLSNCGNLLSISDIPISPPDVYVYNCPKIKQIDQLKRIEGAQVFDSDGE